ncbi:MAG: TMEM165/GDT1 family protein [Candidatus Thorarchaeota archaeon]|jgi:putative Ca2+/H+ antiporter (TMEM165/GDT1 family)
MPIQALMSAFGLVFVTEIGDKTMLTTMCLSAQYRRPAVILLASMLALAIASAIGVVAGVVLAVVIPIEFILYISGALFVIMGIHTLVRNDSELDDCKQPTTFVSMISLVLFSELGDKSQIAILALAVQSTFPILVFIGAMAGFLIVNLIGAYAGDRVAERVPVSTIRKATGLIFIAFGILVLAGFI